MSDATTLIYINQYNTDKQKLEKKNGDANKKISDTAGLVTTAILNTKINEVENKFFDHAKYITNQKFNNLTKKIFQQDQNKLS